MTMFRQLGLMALAAAFAMPSAHAQTYPSHPIHLVVGEAPGGGTDLYARTIGQKLAERINQPVIVENRPGGSGTLGSSFVAHAAPDGYTLLLVTADETIPPLGHKIDYDIVTSFSSITEIGYIASSLVVNTQVPITSLKEFVAYAHANPGKLNIGTSGPEGVGHWSSELLKQSMGIDVAMVAYTGGAPALTAMLGNEVQVTFSPVATSLAMVKAGKLRALAVTGNARSPLLPDVPTFLEAGAKGFEDLSLSQFFGILGPAGIPKDIAVRLHDEIVPILKSDEFQQAMNKRGLVVITSTPEEFDAFRKRAFDKWSAVQSSLGGKQ